MITAELLALAVLKGDTDAVRPLLDCLLETLPDRKRQLLPVKTFKVESDRVRALLFVDPSLGTDVQVDEERLSAQMNRWLNGDRRELSLFGFDRIELYEFPRKVQ